MDENYTNLLSMCAKIIACDELGIEYTTSLGNGVNSYAASEVALEVLDILGIDDQHLTFQTLVGKEKEKLNA